MKTLKEVCEITGTNRQFMQRLAYRDGKPYLLPPTERRGKGQYWYYNEEAIQRLWIILMFRELDGKFDEIERIMNSTGYEQNKWLGKQIDLLKEKQEHIEKMINAAEMIRTTGILPGDLDGNKHYTLAEFIEMSDAAQNLPSDIHKKVAAVMADKSFNNEIKKLVTLRKGGENENGRKTQRTVGRMWQAFRAVMGKGSSLGFRNFGLILSREDILSERYDKACGEGTARYIGKAIEIYCKRHRNMEEIR